VVKAVEVRVLSWAPSSRILPQYFRELCIRLFAGPTTSPTLRVISAPTHEGAAPHRNANMKFLFWSLLLITVVVSISVFGWTAYGSFIACVPGQENASIEKTITILDGILDVGLKLSTTLVGFAAAILIGLKSGLSLTTPVRVSLIISTLLFSQSALYAVWWRLGMANNWLNQCPDLVLEPFMQRRFEAHLGFFLAGLFSLGVLVFVAAINNRDGSISEGTPI
jgi:hypothetical protein